MIEPSKVIYIHGLESSSQSGKARLLSALMPGITTPDFVGSFEERMGQLTPLLAAHTGWTLIGSSFGGLMGAVFTIDHPAQVRRLVLLAPALNLPPFAERATDVRCAVPTVLIHGTRDSVVAHAPVRALARQVFTQLVDHLVDDDHRLQSTCTELDWPSILEAEPPRFASRN